MVRTPGGHVNEAISASAGAPIIRWSVGSPDWKYRDAAYLAESIPDYAKSGEPGRRQRCFPRESRN